MKKSAAFILGVIIMCTVIAGGRDIVGGAGTETVRLILGVRVGEEELAAFQGANNMLMARAVDNSIADTELTVLVSDDGSDMTLTLDGKEIAAGIAQKVALAEGFNSFVFTAEQGDRSETVYVNVERLPAGLYAESTRPLYHFTPYRHQMNDPNGLVFDASTGLYHLFFQCNRPFASGVDAKTRTTGWGHAVSSDLIVWEELPMALTPDLLGAAWSGSGIVDAENTSGLFDDSVPPESRLVVFYANVYGDETYGMAKISMAYSKDGGNTWIKYDGNPVVKNTGNRYGAGLRDPKVIRYENPQLEDGWCWLMVTCGDTHIFTSKDLINWTVQGGIVRDVNNDIVECECPDLFRLPVDGDENNQKWVLTCGGVSYLVGELVITERGYIKFQAETEPIVNLNGIADQIPGIKAPEIYATQTFYNDPAGRRVSMSWIRDPYQDWRDKIWNSAQSLPLVNTLRTFDSGLRLCRYPVEELERARGEQLLSVHGVDVTADGDNILSKLQTDCFDLVAELTPGTADNLEFGIRADNTGDAELKIRYCVSEGVLYINKGGDGWQGEYHPETHLTADGHLQLRIMLDKTCYDVFGNAGEAAVQGILYTLTDATGLYFKADGDARIESLEIWQMGLPNDASDDDNEDDENGKKGLTLGKAALIASGTFLGTLAVSGAVLAIAKRKKK